MSLDVAGWTETSERAFGHPGKDLYHRIDPVLLVGLHERNDVSAVRRELTVQEPVHQVDLSDDVCEVEELAYEVLEGVGVVVREGLEEVLAQQISVGALLVLLLDRHVQIEHEVDDFASFPVLPQPSGYVEDGGLEQQHEADPLVVGVVLDFVARVELVDARVGDVGVDGAPDCSRERERRVDPTVRVDDLRADLFGRERAVDRIAQELPGADGDATRCQDQNRRLIM